MLPTLTKKNKDIHITLSKGLVTAVLCAIYLHIHLLMYMFTYYSGTKAGNFDAI